MTQLSRISWLVVLVVAPLLWATRAAGQNSSQTIVPRLIKFSGTLLDEQAQPMKSPVGVTFALYAQQSGSAALWMETQNVETDAKGNYTVLLGANSANGVPVELFNAGEARWLGVQAERQPEQPRVLLVSVPYALKAGDAQTLGGLPPSAFAPAGSLASNSASSSSAPSVTLLAPSLTTSAAPLAAISGSGATNFIPLWTPNGSTLGNSILFQSTASNVNVNGSFSLPATGTATSTAGFNSQPLDFLASAFNNSPLPGTAVNQHFRWQSEPVNNNTASPSGKLNLLFASGTGTPAETGLSISSKGLITFASGQTFPTVSGNETVTGDLSASQLISTVATGTAPLSVKSTTLVPNLNANFLGGMPAGAFATLGPNTFAGTQAINGNLALAQTTGATVGVVTMGAKTFIHSCCVGVATDNTFVGPGAGNFSLGINAGANTALGARTLAADTSGFDNTAIGSDALTSNTSGAQNVAVGGGALSGNMTGLVNTAVGLSTLGNNTTGNTNAALGGDALQFNGTGSNNTALGFRAGVTSNFGNANTSGSNNTFLGYQTGPGTATQLTNATAIGANALVSASNSLVLGGTGANAVKVGIGTATPGATLDVNGNAKFSGPVTFAAGQTFPAGTVTGNETVQGNVSASGQLISTVATGTAPLSVTSTTQVQNLNASLLGGLGPGAFAQLAAANIFTKTQTINANLGIGIPTPSFPLHVNGTMRSETGLSLGGNASLNVDAPGVPSGHFTVQPNGNVGIGTASPSFLLHVNGPVRAEGGLSVNGFGGLNVDLTAKLGGTIPGGIFTVQPQPSGRVGIGIANPTSLLHVNGTVRAETGLSLSSAATLSVDAPFVPGGHFTVLPNGNVGINNPNPSATLDVRGSVGIGGDTPMSSNPHMSFSGLILGSFCNDPTCGCATPDCVRLFVHGGHFVPDKAITITRVSVALSDAIDPSCGHPAGIALRSGPTFTDLFSVPIPLNVDFFDSGPVSVAIPAGTRVLIGLSNPTTSCTVGSSGGGNGFVNVEYVMQ